MMELGDGVKKFFLLGVGAAAASVEKSTEILDELVKKGELTVEQGKVFNQELKRSVKEAQEAKPSQEAADEPKDFEKLVASLTPQELEKLKEEIGKAQV